MNHEEKSELWKRKRKGDQKRREQKREEIIVDTTNNINNGEPQNLNTPSKGNVENLEESEHDVLCDKQKKEGRNCGHTPP